MMGDLRWLDWNDQMITGWAPLYTRVKGRKRWWHTPDFEIHFHLHLWPWPLKSEEPICHQIRSISYFLDVNLTNEKSKSNQTHKQSSIYELVKKLQQVMACSEHNWGKCTSFTSLIFINIFVSLSGMPGKLMLYFFLSSVFHLMQPMHKLVISFQEVLHRLIW